MNCERHKVSQTRCSRKAAVTRITTKFKTVRLCAKCDALFGDVVGEKAPASMQPNGGTR